ncbi:hypothetical protein COO20_05240 [Thalassospira marina]|uniref:Uncharacterized protein n=1 Tax=Thalassospira marina TaxID=2048283 RepID=A0A2N3KYM2_9PROT|nr:hypothetical protein COO20_05240 [Thalassospira marina]
MPLKNGNDRAGFDTATLFCKRGSAATGSVARLLAVNRFTLRHALMPIYQPVLTLNKNVHKI